MATLCKALFLVLTFTPKDHSPMRMNTIRICLVFSFLFFGLSWSQESVDTEVQLTQLIKNYEKIGEYKTKIFHPQYFLQFMDQNQSNEYFPVYAKALNPSSQKYLEAIIKHVYFLANDTHVSAQHYFEAYIALVPKTFENEQTRHQINVKDVQGFLRLIFNSEKAKIHFMRLLEKKLCKDLLQNTLKDAEDYRKHITFYSISSEKKSYNGVILPRSDEHLRLKNNLKSSLDEIYTNKVPRFIKHCLP